MENEGLLTPKEITKIVAKIVFDKPFVSSVS